MLFPSVETFDRHLEQGKSYSIAALQAIRTSYLNVNDSADLAFWDGGAENAERLRDTVTTVFLADLGTLGWM